MKLTQIYFLNHHDLHKTFCRIFVGPNPCLHKLISDFENIIGF